MSHTTTFALGSALVTLTRSASAFLWKRFFSRTRYITEILCFLKNVPVFVLKIIENVFNDITSQGQIVNTLVKFNYFTWKSACFEIKDWYLHSFISLKGSAAPRLSHKGCLVRFVQNYGGDLALKNLYGRSKKSNRNHAPIRPYLLKHHFING